MPDSRSRSFAFPAELDSSSLAAIQKIVVASENRIMKAIADMRTEERRLMSELDDALADLTTRVTNESSVIDGVSRMVDGLVLMIQQQVKGLTDAQKQQIAAIGSGMTANDAKLAAALAAGTIVPPASLTAK